jgi:hypothetical protein
VSKSPVGFLYRAVESVETFTLPDYFVSKLQGPILGKGINNISGIQAQRRPVKPEMEIILEAEIDPAELSSVRAQVEKAMAKMKGVISEQRYEEVVAHGVQRKLADMKIPK